MDEVIQDLGNQNVGYYDGVFGGFETLGVDMYGDLNLDEDLPIAQPRKQPQNNSNVYVKVNRPKPVKKYVTRGDSKPSFVGELGVDNRDLMIMGVGALALIYLAYRG